MILQENKRIEYLKYKPAAIVKKFEDKTRRRFKGINKAIFKYGAKQLAKAGRERNAIKGEWIDDVVRWGLNLTTTMIFGTN